MFSFCLVTLGCEGHVQTTSVDESPADGNDAGSHSAQPDDGDMGSVITHPDATSDTMLGGDAGMTRPDEPTADDDPVDWPALYRQAMDWGAAVYVVGTESEMQAALDAVDPGDVILVEGGDHEDWNLQFHRSGTAERPVVVTALSKATGEGTPVTFHDSTRFGRFQWASFYIMGGFTFENILQEVYRLDETETSDPASTDNRFTDSTYRGCGVQRGAAVGLIDIHGRSHRTRIDHSVFEHNYSHIRVRYDSADRELGTTQDTRVDHNIIRDPATSGFRSGVYYEIAAFQTCCGGGGAGNPPIPLLFEHNEIHHFRGPNADHEILEIKSSGAVIRHNRITSDGSSVSLRGGNHSVVHSNLLEGANISMHGAYHQIYNNIINGAGVVKQGISVFRWGRRGPPNCTNTADTHDLLIAHNTIVDTHSYGIRIGDCGSGACRPLHDNIDIYNNLISMSEGKVLHVNTRHEDGRTETCASDNPGDADGGTNSGITLRGNLFHARGSAVVGSGVEVDESPIVGDPQLERLEILGNTVLLGDGSELAIDAASPLPPSAPDIIYDFEGQPRTCGGGADVGADEGGC